MTPRLGRRWIGALLIGVLVGFFGSASPAAQQVTNAIVIRSLQAIGLFGTGYTNGQIPAWSTTQLKYLPTSGSGGAPTNATYITQIANGSLTNEQPLAALATALLISTTATGVVSAYAGASCTNQFPRALSAVGAATCASVALAADVSGDLPFANFTQASAASKLLGRGSAAGAGDYEEITLGTGLSMTGTTLSSSGGAPTDATYITQVAEAGLSAEQPLAALASGIMRVAITTGVVTSLTTSAGIAANISDETGSGALVFAAAPALTGIVTVDDTTGTSFIVNSTAAGGSAIQIQRSGTAKTRLGQGLAGHGADDTTLYSDADLWLSAAGNEIRITNDMLFASINNGTAGDTDACLNVTTFRLVNAAASTCIVSSLRYKDGWTPLPSGALAKVLRLETGSYYLKNDPKRVAQIGLNAENVAAIEPRLSFPEVDGPDIGKPRGVLYEQSVALLTKAIQELTTCVKSPNPSRCVAQLEAQ